VERAVIWALHGFLGDGGDWDFLRGPLRAIGCELHAPSLFASSAAEEDLRIDPAGESLTAWTRRFIEYVAARDSSPIILGYSLGGRLALHLLAERSSTFKAGIIVSAGLGIEGEGERRRRRVDDSEWARRIEHEDWQSVARDWNAQPLFNGPMPGERVESAFDRRRLGAALRSWSPAVQAPFKPRLGEITVPTLWIAGEDDAAYAAAGRRAVESLPNGSLWICPNSGHRVPWEQPQRFTEQVIEYLQHQRR
jgi:2-succinyl-6-hydroxy-2,4-cyclohexadiene-1-carboxylate synthase